MLFLHAPSKAEIQGDRGRLCYHMDESHAKALHTLLIPHCALSIINHLIISCWMKRTFAATMCCTDRFVDHQVVSNLTHLFVGCWLRPVHVLLKIPDTTVIKVGFLPGKRQFQSTGVFGSTSRSLIVGWLVGWLDNFFHFCTSFFSVCNF